MRRLLLVLFALMALFAPFSLGACAASHYEEVVRIAASKHPRQCTAPYTVTKLNSWGYRVDACEGTLYYRCSNRRKSLGRTQCCHEVANADRATALLSASDPTEMCVELVD